MEKRAQFRQIAEALLQRAVERRGAVVRPRGCSWKRAGMWWRAARALVRAGRAVVFGTKHGAATGSPWTFREVLVAPPEMRAELAERYPGCEVTQ